MIAYNLLNGRIAFHVTRESIGPILYADWAASLSASRKRALASSCKEAQVDFRKLRTVQRTCGIVQLKFMHIKQLLYSSNPFSLKNGPAQLC